MFIIKRDPGRNGEVIRRNEWEKWGMEYLTFPKLEETGLVKHLFTTRTGGVSQGIYSTMNLSFTRGDEKSAVLENYERVAQVLGCSVSDMVASDQTHTTNIRRVTKADGGKGILAPKDYTDVDGLITGEPGLVLVTFYADCVPLYFVDVEKRAIGLAHSGWRGTVNGMGNAMVQAMGREFGSKPADIRAAIGPSICQACYEVSEDVAREFAEKFGEDEELCEMLYTNYNYPRKQVVTLGKAEGKYQLDLWLANALILLKAGIPPEQIAITDICTCHNSDYLFSHRASMGKRGNLAAFLMLSEKENEMQRRI